ncbi:TatD family hydrolase [Luteolibacter ambystomatis]|uniref:TatD family hydrolase n=1 Tax=Luteolibacter ambystomatis TaxID=2824561 RepID=A0A975J1R1_9BACT|nr:TatD family hydrolase [Luteolibacter ambystomatis]QUE52438.1 TatD family hydrolase [Luteolibacter ambystomatis]
MFIDAHNHLHDPRLGDPAPVIAEMRASGIDACMVNATCEDDWPLVEALAMEHPDFVLPAYGVHPWKAHLAAPGWEDRLHALLDRSPGAAIGECGLDRWVKEPDIAVQSPVFEAQLRLAREFDRPVVIHCLKAWQPLFESFGRMQPPRRFLMHSFNGSIETARRLIPLGAYFSFSGYFLQARKAEVVETFRQLPPDRILIETDAPDMLPPDAFITHPLEGANHPANLSAIARGFAAAMGLDSPGIAVRTTENFCRFFRG